MGKRVYISPQRGIKNDRLIVSVHDIICVQLERIATRLVCNYEPMAVYNISLWNYMQILLVLSPLKPVLITHAQSVQENTHKAHKANSHWWNPHDIYKQKREGKSGPIYNRTTKLDCICCNYMICWGWHPINSHMWISVVNFDWLMIIDENKMR